VMGLALDLAALLARLTLELPPVERHRSDAASAVLKPVLPGSGALIVPPILPLFLVPALPAIGVTPLSFGSRTADSA
jgi:hypothetical protein